MAILVAVSVVFVVRLVFLLAAPNGPFHAPLVPEGDELDYLPLAQRLADTDFTRYRIPERTNDQRRPPVMPSVGALFLLVFGRSQSFIAAWSVLQLLLLSAALGFVLDLARRMGFRPWLSLVVLFSVFDLMSLASSARFLSESLYTALFAFSVWLLPLGQGETGRRGAVPVSGLVLGLATLTRPIAQFFVVPAAALAAVRAKGPALRRAIPAATLIAAFLLPVGAWMVRNRLVYHRAFISEIGDLNLYLYWAAQAEAWSMGRSLSEVQKQFEARLGAATAADPTSACLRQEFLFRQGEKILRRHPGALPRFLIRAPYRLFFGRATSAMNTLYDETPVGILDHLRHGAPFPFLLLIGGEFLALLAMNVLVLATIGRVLTRHRHLLGRIALLLLPVVYHLALSWGPEATARFRIPMMPWLIVVAACIALPKKRDSLPVSAESPCESPPYNTD